MHTTHITLRMTRMPTDSILRMTRMHAHSEFRQMPMQALSTFKMTHVHPDSILKMLSQQAYPLHKVHNSYTLILLMSLRAWARFLLASITYHTTMMWPLLQDVIVRYRQCWETLSKTNWTWCPKLALLKRSPLGNQHHGAVICMWYTRKVGQAQTLT